MHSAIYEGTVWHHRLLPRPHRFSYRVAMLYLDLDELAQVFAQSRWWSLERWNLAALYRSDYHRGDTTDLKSEIWNTIAAAGGDRLQGPVRMLSNVRYGGFLINPITCFYCFDTNEQLRYVVADVTNTPWRERHSYVLPVTGTSNSGMQRFSKALHVSPFMPMDLDYHWHSNVPAQQLGILMTLLQQGDAVFKAGLRLQRQECSGRNLSRLLWRFPLMTLQVAVGIYWQALRLWLKRSRFHAHPDRVRTTTIATNNSPVPVLDISAGD
ncbi:MAG: DUF1365 domain-containing protein [Pseudomonadota bacterium]